jgi:hypothetical protein
LQRLDAGFDFEFVQIVLWEAVALLVAAGLERVERERVRVGRLRRLLLLDEHAEHAALDRRERFPRRRGRCGCGRRCSGIGHAFALCE